MEKKVLAVISARSGSKGIPGKNLKLLGAKPLVWHIFKKTLASQLIDRVVCSTDDGEIAQIAKEANVDVPFMRPSELSGDKVPLITVTQYMMQELDKQGYSADIIVQLAPTCPFIRTKSIDLSIKMVMEEDCECAVSLKRIEHEHPYRARHLSENNYFDNFIKDINVEAFHSRQDLPTLFCTTGGIYTRQRHLLEQYDESDFALGKRHKGVVLDDIEAVNIDRPIDFQLAEFLIEKGYAEGYLI